MTARPFFKTAINDLEAAFDRQRTDLKFLQELIDELSYRSTERAGRLKSRAVQALGTLPKPSQSGPDIKQPKPPHTVEPVTPPASAQVAAAASIRADPKPMPQISNAPNAVLSAWTALEVLSPPSFQRPEALAGGDKRAVARLDTGRLPWEGKGEKARPNTRLYYQIVLGTVDLAAAVTRLMSVFADTRPEYPTARGEAVLAVIMVDREGRPLMEPTSPISSFGWGVPKALSGDLNALGAWHVAEKPLVEGLFKFINHVDDRGDPRPLDANLIHAAYDWLVESLGLPADLVKPPSFAIRTYEYFKNSEPPEGLLLNSFFLKDLAAASDQFRRNAATDNLKRYLGVVQPTARRDLLHDKVASASAVRPALFSPGRWPGPGRHPLVLLQQAAVNLAIGELRQSGILAVNGPPGTGKTTLLRDIVAALVTERARVMASFNDPADAFTHSGEKLRAGNAWLHLYKLDKRLRGFEMLVASSNNKAVENVSAELPGLSAIADDAEGLRYFTSLSDVLRDRETWGLVAAVLGNAANQARFRQIFWWHNDVGLSTYLAAAAGTPQVFEVTDPVTATTTTRPPRIVTEAQAPRDHDEALRRWRQAREVFKKALNRSEAALQELDAIRVQSERLPAFSATEAQARSRFQVATANTEDANVLSRNADQALLMAQASRDAAVSAWQQHGNSRPGFFARLFRTARFQAWHQISQEKQTSVRQATEAAEQTSVMAAEAKKQLEQARSVRTNAEREALFAAKQMDEAVRSVEAARERLGAHFIDQSFFDREHAERHRVAPWLDAATHRLRDEVFVAAMGLHKAFIDAAAKPLRHNIGALLKDFSGRTLSGAEKEALLPDLWTSLFLVVPVVSTTFASVDRMLGKLPPEALGWLLIDEAGQALPQAAVGAVMRTQRAVVVGDPIQIEPVVVLPDTLTDTICRRFGVDPDRFNAPAASVQTLADAATPYVAEFAGRQGSRTVGVPLLVHRRCAEPMFGISNAVAYERLMVNAKAPGTSTIRDLIGPSRWFDVQGAAEEKWCPQEGRLVITMLQQMASAGINPNLYIVTPFVVVQDNLRKMIHDSGVLNGWTDNPRAWTNERVGTVHVVQGREAEAVIFVLGAPAPQQTGARGWAGGRPNLLNVAVTRAKEALYVVGNRSLWREAGLFRELDARLP